MWQLGPVKEVEIKSVKESWTHMTVPSWQKWFSHHFWILNVLASWFNKNIAKDEPNSSCYTWATPPPLQSRIYRRTLYGVFLGEYSVTLNIAENELAFLHLSHMIGCISHPRMGSCQGKWRRVWRYFLFFPSFQTCCFRVQIPFCWIEAKGHFKNASFYYIPNWSAYCDSTWRNLFISFLLGVTSQLH